MKRIMIRLIGVLFLLDAGRSIIKMSMMFYRSHDALFLMLVFLNVILALLSIGVCMLKGWARSGMIFLSLFMVAGLLFAGFVWNFDREIIIRLIVLIIGVSLFSLRKIKVCF